MEKKIITPYIINYENGSYLEVDNNDDKAIKLTLHQSDIPGEPISEAGSIESEIELPRKQINEFMAVIDSCRREINPKK
jgi:hypothetical protein